jgi:PAS domain S-box-containing protein
VSLLALIIALAVFAVAYREVRRTTLASVHSRFDGAIQALGERLGEQIPAALKRAHDLVRNPPVAAYLRNPTPATRTAYQAVMGTVRPGTGSTYWIDEVGPDGVPVAGHDPARPPLALFDTETLRALEQGVDSAGVGAFHQRDGILAYPLVVAVSDTAGLAGHLVIWQRVTPASFQTDMVARLIGDGSRVFIGTPGVGWVGGDTILETPGSAADTTAGLLRLLDSTGSGVLALSIAVPGTPWSMIVAAPEHALLAPVRRFARSAGLTAAMVVAVGLGAGLVITRRLTQPLELLTEAAEAMGVGHHEIRVAVRSGDEVGRLATTFNAMAERVGAEIRASELVARQWQLLFVDNPHPMWIFDRETLRFLAVNDAAAAKYGWTREEFLRMTIAEIRPAEDLPALRQVLAEGPPSADTPIPTRHRRKDGTVMEVEVRVQPLQFTGREAFLVLAQDVTKRQALERAVRQSQKMEAIGRLAGGIAHDFNNYLTVIMTYAGMAREGLADAAPLAQDLREITTAAERAHALTRQLLAFSRQDVVQQVDFDPATILDRLQGMLQRVLGERIQVEYRREGPAGWVRMDPGQFEQVLVNLAVNARDAMPEGGRLDITLGEAVLDDLSATLHGVADAGRYVVISVSDSGVGMSAEVRARIFEPFFTTKEAGKGTGLGLATAYGIVGQASGSMTVYSEIGSGSTFRIYLPARAAVAALPADRPAEDPLPRGTETILLIEDDAAVRNATAAALARLGYSLLLAQGAEEALAQLERRHVSVDLILSDVVMPGTDGPTLARQLMAQRPGTRAILMSGYAGDVLTARGGLGEGVSFLPKPFTVSALARLVRAVLDGRGDPPIG